MHIYLLYLLNYLLTYLLTPWCRVLLEKLTGLHLVKKISAFYGTRRFITALTSVCHLSLSWASPIQSIYPYPTSWRSILILSTKNYTLKRYYYLCVIYYTLPVYEILLVVRIIFLSKSNPYQLKNQADIEYVYSGFGVEITSIEWAQQSKFSYFSSFIS